MTPDLRISLAGQVEVRAGDRPPVSPQGLGRLGRVAFAFLVCERHRPVSRDELAEALWGDDLPKTWETSLRGVISRVRSALAGAGSAPAGTLTTRNGAYQLVLPPTALVDVELATAGLDDAREALARRDHEAARDSAQRAVAIAARPFLVGASGRWVERRQSELREVHVGALEALSTACAGLGRWPEARAAAEEAVALEPLRESAHLRLMAAHSGAGNRGAALRAYERCRRSLVEELGVDPSPPMQEAYVALLGEERVEAPTVAPTVAPAVASTVTSAVAPAGPAAPTVTNSLVGRERDLAETAARLAGGSLVTLLGPGGVGKTRLALEVAGEVTARFPGGVWTAELAAVSDPALVPHRVMDAVGAREGPGQDALAALLSHVGERRALLVLDNCEHVVDATARLVERLLSGCPGLAVLATARQALGVPGEITRPVDPLALEPATRLLAQRVTAARSGQPPAPDDASELARIARRLDGIPLALELAGARARALSLAEIADRLDDRFRLLTGGARTGPARHRTLRAAVDWSWDALSPPEQRLFARLAVFAGAFELEAAEQVGHGGAVLEEDVVVLLASLVDLSLVTADPTGKRTRFRLLETLREYGRERLDELGERAVAEGRLLRWAASLVRQAEPELDGPHQTAWLARLDAELDNLRAALAGARTGPAGPGGAAAGEAVAGPVPPPEAVSLAASLGRYWEARGHFEEGRAHLEGVLATRHRSARAAPEVDPSLRAQALTAAAVLAQRQGDFRVARTHHEESLVIRRALGDDLGTAVALHGLGNLAALRGDLDAARSLYEQCLAAGQALDDVRVVVASLSNLGWVAHRQGRHAEARSRYEESLARCRKAEDVRGTAVVLADLADLARSEGDHLEAERLLRESLGLRRDTDDRPGVADCLGALGRVALERGDLARARTLLGEAVALRREMGDRSGLSAPLADLGEVAVAEGRGAEGRALLEESLAVARELGDRRCEVGAVLGLAALTRAEGDAGAAETSLREVAPARGSAPDAETAAWLEGLAGAAYDSGELWRSARLLGAAAAVRKAVGAPVPGHRAGVLASDAAGVRAGLGEQAFAEQFELGRAAPEDAAG